jgi:DNA sulfur modification protein DndD
MLIERLALCDFGVFCGRHIFELAPRKKYGKARPVVLFGGLNGAGKTTILTAVRLALYGRGSLGLGVPQQEYLEFLSKSIHKNPDSLVPGDSASVALEFEHAQLGVRHQYRVERAWSVKGRTCSERVKLLQSGKEIPGLTQEQAQAFLNQLVPPGVSQFFFFDGEKIASLATDGADDALRDSIRRLLGLDLVERLRADLAVFARHARATQSAEVALEIGTTGLELEAERKSFDLGQARLRDQLIPALDDAKARLEGLTQAINQRGGVWAKDRATVEARIDELLHRKASLEDDLRSCVASELPLSLAPGLCKQVTTQLEKESAAVRAKTKIAAVKEGISVLHERLLAELPKTTHSRINSIVKALASDSESSAEGAFSTSLHSLGEADGREVTRLFVEVAQHARSRAVNVIGKILQVECELAELTVQMARAPSDASLQGEFAALTQAGIEVGRLQEEKAAFVDGLRRQTWHCIELTRRLRKLEESASHAWTSDQADVRAVAVRELMTEFSSEVTRQKLVALRRHFIESFVRLARKEDLVSDAVIDERDFSVTLIDHRGNRLPKDRLSAGERQIYAIAMLEALAKTSGRNLPVIIDTPLGRLDSKHRKKLVEQYFPHASHQVIILSTDTEVDEPFYQGLAKHVSHAFHLVFDERSRASTPEEGYFWKQMGEEHKHAA